MATLSTGETDTRRLSTASRRWRLVASAVLVFLLLYGTYADTDDLWPFGPLSQYAGKVDLDGEVRSVYVLAETVDGETVHVPLTATGVGIGRAEIEGQLDRIVADPSMLQALARAQEALHPAWSDYVRLYVMRDTTRLRDGSAVGDPTTETLAEWTVSR